jgi:hypothetical protein
MTKTAILTTTVLLTVACGPSTADRADIGRAITSLQTDDRVERTLGAIAAQHVIKRQSRFSLRDRIELRWWQRELQPAVPPLVKMLSDDAGLEWVDPNATAEPRITTPRKEAVPALVGLERAAVEPLIAALDDRERARRAHEVLRQITGGQGPSESASASWRSWWQQHQGEALPGERGQTGTVLTRLLTLVLVVASVVFGQRLLAARAARQRLRLRGD